MIWKKRSTAEPRKAVSLSALSAKRSGKISRIRRGRGIFPKMKNFMAKTNCRKSWMNTITSSKRCARRRKRRYLLFEIMITIFIFLILLGLLIFVHELGHFLVAKWNGIKSHEFGFGFPPRLVGVVKNDATGRYKVIWGNRDVKSPHTVYSLNWLPLGGFVKIKGEDGHSQDPDSFAGKSAWIRTKVLGAGVAMNFIFAWLLISIVFTLGLPQPIDPSQRAQYQ